MGGYQFHTALLGGFRKRDVVRYLAEEKRLQEEALEELRQQASELEQQLDETRTAGGADRLLNQELQQEKEELLARQSELEQQTEEARAALARAEEALAQSRKELAQSQEALSRTEAALCQSQAQQDVLTARLAESGEAVQPLTRQLEELRAAPAVPVEDGERRRLLEELRAERQRAAQLESRLREDTARPDTPDGADQLWSLCGKMERTIRQMERLLDGPYRVTCYPAEPVRQTARPQPEEREGEPASAAEPDNGVSSLLRRVRGR